MTTTRFERETAKLRAQMAGWKAKRVLQSVGIEYIGNRVNINWQLIALELRKHIPLVQASKRLGKHKLWLNQIARGEVQEPKFSDGLRLLDFAHDRIGADRLRELG